MTLKTKKIVLTAKQREAWKVKNDERREKGKAIINKLRTQVLETPEGKMFFAVFAQAITDLTDYRERRTACWYFQRENFIHLELAGLDQSYVRRVIKTVGLDYTMP